MNLPNLWQEAGWEADWCSPYLIISNPAGECASVVIEDSATRRNITLKQFRDSVETHGITKACGVFWKLRANQCAR
ncbi:hypothetical protein LO749_20775 [Paracoccus denitrificans]|uniref:hypothetical protein n=1 Tax=Paracoccus denitrificans TaxID=266 RepID=UPI001E289A6B|nr:hypothetical protein [Paracoccus denitrificans]UFS66931.1 hypothetical protein LO749_20775 [Paracoccus denitrificans]